MYPHTLLLFVCLGVNEVRVIVINIRTSNNCILFHFISILFLFKDFETELGRMKASDGAAPIQKAVQLGI